jgi:hypothetical protein
MSSFFALQIKIGQILYAVESGSRAWGIESEDHCCPVKMSEKQNGLYFDLLNGIRKYKP